MGLSVAAGSTETALTTASGGSTTIGSSADQWVPNQPRPLTLDLDIGNKRKWDMALNLHLMVHGILQLNRHLEWASLSPYLFLFFGFRISINQ